VICPVKVDRPPSTSHFYQQRPTLRIDLTAGRNHYAAPSYMNADVRLSKYFQLGERVKLQALVEFFNLFNRDNPFSVQQSVGLPKPFGAVTQVLPGREGQLGLKIGF
jgi:hypothetical protein